MTRACSSPACLPSPLHAKPSGRSWRSGHRISASSEAGLRHRPGGLVPGRWMSDHRGMSASKMPEFIGKYKIQRELGRGASSTVYLAEDPFTDRKVAVKRIPAHLLQDD